eukprot:g56649.t1
MPAKDAIVDTLDFSSFVVFRGSKNIMKGMSLSQPGDNPECLRLCREGFECPGRISGACCFTHLRFKSEDVDVPIPYTNSAPGTRPGSPANGGATSASNLPPGGSHHLHRVSSTSASSTSSGEASPAMGSPPGGATPTKKHPHTAHRRAKNVAQQHQQRGLASESNQGGLLVPVQMLGGNTLYRGVAFSSPSKPVSVALLNLAPAPHPHYAKYPYQDRPLALAPHPSRIIHPYPANHHHYGASPQLRSAAF